MLESELWQSMKAGMDKNIHWQRLESPSTAAGIPDANGCLFGVEVWIELKIIDVNQVGTITPFQVSWLKSRWLAGGRTFIIAAKESGQGFSTYAWRGIDAAGVRRLGIKDPAVIARLICYFGPPPDWAVIQSWVFGHDWHNDKNPFYPLVGLD